MTLEEYRNQQHEIDLVVFHGIFKTQNAHGGRNVMPRCLSEGVDIFLKSADRQGESGHDVRVSRSAPWMARVGNSVMMRTTVSLFIRKFTPGDVTSRRDVPFAVGVRGVYGNPTLRDMHQFINVSQKVLHIYFIDGCRVCPLDARYKNRTK